jgi:hypothetical protein
VPLPTTDILIPADIEDSSTSGGSSQLEFDAIAQTGTPPPETRALDSRIRMAASEFLSQLSDSKHEFLPPCFSQIWPPEFAFTGNVTDEVVEFYRWREAFYGHFWGPSVHYRISTALISTDHRHAIIRVTNSCVLCGSSSFLLFEKTGRGWKAIGSHLLWVS